MSASSRVYEFVQDRRHAGQLADATAVGRSNLDGQPPHTSLYVREHDGMFCEGRYQTSGCGFLVACCAAAIELSLGRPLRDCVTIDSPQIIDYLGGLPPNRLYCADLAAAALHDALAAQVALFSSARE